MLLNDLTLTLDTINASKLDAGCIKVIGGREHIVSDSASKQPSEIWLTMLTTRGSRNTVKLPLTDDNRAKLNDLLVQLKGSDTVIICLDNPRVRAYAFPGRDGSVISGVSVKADSFEIVDDYISV